MLKKKQATVREPPNLHLANESGTEDSKRNSEVEDSVSASFQLAGNPKGRGSLGSPNKQRKYLNFGNKSSDKSDSSSGSFLGRRHPLSSQDQRRRASANDAFGLTTTNAATSCYSGNAELMNSRLEDVSQLDASESMNTEISRPESKGIENLIYRIEVQDSGAGISKVSRCWYCLLLTHRVL